MKIIGFLKNIPRKLILRRLRELGYSSYSASTVLDKGFEDIFRNKKTTLSQKLWAQKRGFFSDSIKLYGLNDDNYLDYLSDFDYYWLHPINGAYSRWIDDKLTFKYILQPFSEYLPEYYYHIYHGEILRLMDCPAGYQNTIQDAIKLLHAKGSLAVKLTAAEYGKGFCKLAHEQGEYSINGEPATRDGVEELLASLLRSTETEYIISEYLQSHNELQKICPQTASVLRIDLIRELNADAKVMFADILFPTCKSGMTTNAASNSVGCLVDFQTGRFYNPDMLVDGKLIQISRHPDTDVLLEGVLPNWLLISAKILEICKFLPQLRLMGMDIIITNDGFKIIEINSLPGLSYMQGYFPVFKDENAGAFFTRRLEEKKRAQGF